MIAVPVLLYGRTVTFDYVHADDVDLIAGNQPFLTDFSNLPEAFRRSYFESEGDVGSLKTYYRPLAIASFMLDAQRAGARPAAYHATNVALHVAAVLLLFHVLTSLGVAQRAALLGTLLFAVHPLNAQAVCWIAGRNELLFGVFTLASVLTLLQWLETKRSVWFVLHVVCFALALFSKETGIVIPMVTLLYWALWRPQGRRRMLISVVAAYMVIAGMWYGLREAALAGSPATATSLAGAAANVPQLLVYLGKLVAPLQLNVMPGVEPWTLLLGLIALVACVAAARALPWRIAVFSAAWLLLFIAPTLLVPDLPVYEHRMYVPMMGAALAVSHLLTRPTAGALARRVVTVCIVAFALQTFLHSAVFENPFTYWQNGTRSARYAPIAHVNLGQLSEQSGDLKRALEEYRHALALDPDTPKAHNNIGVVLMRIEQPARAVVHFREETRRHPWNAEAWFNLGLWAEMQGDAVEARRSYERAIAENPAFLPAYEKLGISRK